MNPEFIAQNEPESTGRYIVTFREGASTEAVAALENFTGVRDSDLVRSADFQDSGIDMAQIPSEGGAVLGACMDASSVQAAFRATIRESGIQKRLTIRSLRHAHATHLLELGMDMRLIQDLM